VELILCLKRYVVGEWLKHMPNYKEKLTYPLSDEEFVKGMKKGKFCKSPEHLGLNAFLFYTASRLSEALKMEAKQFRLVKARQSGMTDSSILMIDIGERLKHSKRTPPLEIPLEAPYVDFIQDSYSTVKKDKRVWPYCRKTGYNIIKRVFYYPHYFRLSRITRFFAEGFTIAEVTSWTGLSLKALDYYVGLVSISKMGRALVKK